MDCPYWSWKEKRLETIDCAVVGASVVGLAIARALSVRGLDVIVLEAASGTGTGITSRNSAVIHAGLYYPEDSLKARLCVEGREMLYAFCQDRNIAARRTGKFIVATDAEQAASLEALRQRAAGNGVKRIELWPAARVAEAEPEIRCRAALYSPGTGIIDINGLMLALRGDLEASGGWVALESPVVGLRPFNNGFELSTGGQDPATIVAKTVVNAAGLHSAEVAALLGAPAVSVPRVFYAKGNYFSLSGVKTPFRHLVYPVPVPGGLGIHATLDLQGAVRFGPDVEWTERLDYRVDPARAASFYGAIRIYWPGLPDGALVPDYAGIRPKISGPGEPAEDFYIAFPAQTGLPGYVHLAGIESPGLTASLAIAAYVAAGLGL